MKASLISRRKGKAYIYQMIKYEKHENISRQKKDGIHCKRIITFSFNQIKGPSHTKVISVIFFSNRAKHCYVFDVILTLASTCCCLQVKDLKLFMLGKNSMIMSGTQSEWYAEERISNLQLMMMLPKVSGFSSIY